ncbi:pilus assembly FimT family protein [Limisphaera sp. VF-2]|uniref:pilus assembly FimT family protein n=1 Tax=Limisphaera sp. VF-2 TaxID=3400418 RepID=UPI00176D739D|nr:hypothetical protein [Limisphaera sp.]
MNTPVSPPAPNRPVRGAALIELVVYIAVAGVILVGSMKAFYECFSASHRLREQAQRISQALRAGERWRADVRLATGPPQLESMPGGQRMTIPQANGRVQYEFGPEGVYRAGPEHAGPVLVLRNVAASQVQSELRHGVAVWRWDLALVPDRRSTRLRPVFTFLAVPPQTP